MPYLTLDEYRSAPTATGLYALSPAGGSDEAVEAEARRVIARAGAWIDSYCDQPLCASSYTQTTRARASRRGDFVFSAERNPVIKVVSFGYGSHPGSLTTADPSQAWVERRSIHVPGGGATLGLESIQLGSSLPGTEWVTSCTYIHGWASSVTTVAVTGGNALTLDPTGYVAGRRYTIFDGASTQEVTVTVVGASTITVSETLLAHAAGVRVSDMPEDVTEAAILAVTAFITSRGNEAMVMGNSQAPGPTVDLDPSTAATLRLAKNLLTGYRRIR